MIAARCVDPILCGLCASPPTEASPVFDFEEHTGKWQHACHHTACIPCLRRLIESQAPRCEKERQLRICCHEKDCQKHIPQSLILSVSKVARGLASRIDCVLSPERAACGVCGAVAYLMVNDACGHKACEDCCERHASTYDSQLSLPCWDPLCRLSKGGPTEIPQSFWAKEFPFHPLTPVLSKTPHVVENYPFILRDGGPTTLGPVCPVCRERVPALIHDKNCPGDCNHAACEECWKRWAEEQLPACFAANSMTIRCIGPGCGQLIGTTLWNYLAPRQANPGRSTSSRVLRQESLRPLETRRVLSAGQAAVQGPLVRLRRALERRAALVENRLFPPSMQVNCPRWDCVGLGYLGYDTVMCFICEHQWIPDEGAGDAPAEVDPEVVMGIAVKRCPKCNEHIEKNGGCDHMTCRCKYEFYWSTLKPYRPS